MKFYRISSLIILILMNMFCKSFDIHPDYLVGTDFHINQSLSKNENCGLQVRKDILFFMNRIPNTIKIRDIESKKIEFATLPFIAGQFLSNSNNEQDLITFLKIDMNVLEKVEKEEFIIVHDIKVIYNSNFFGDLFKVFPVIMFSHYNFYAELGKIKKTDLTKYLHEGEVQVMGNAKK